MNSYTVIKGFSQNMLVYLNLHKPLNTKNVVRNS